MKRQKSKIIIIGLQNLDDWITLHEHVAPFLKDTRDNIGLAQQLFDRDFEVFDMTNFPERGDAFDAIDEATQLVIALHLYGIDQCPVPDRYLSSIERAGALYRGKDGRNGKILERCMELKIPLVCWGDQPWMGVECKTQIHSNSLWIYESQEKKKNTQVETREIS